MNIENGLSTLIQMLRPDNPMLDSLEGKWRLYRALVNTRTPGAISEAYVRLEDDVLQAIHAQRGVTQGETLPVSPLDARLSLWQGDITTLAVDAIVNAANEQLLGCFIPCHSCIDNAIHTYAGVRLRAACNALMEAQGHEEPVGHAKITPGFALPSRYVIHTVGPTVEDTLTDEKREALASCYESCLTIANENALESIAFCCISTGVYRFPKPEAAQIAIQTVRAYLNT